VSDLRKAQAKREKQAETEPLAAKFEEKGGSKEILIDLGRTTQSRSAERPAETIAPETRAPGNDFASQLAERLRESGNTDIVQSARIILKDGDAGTIRMRLNPPELGNVKIELKLADNSISGKIVVESDVAKTAFEKGLADLQDAFRSGGFESAQLEVSVGSGNAGQDRPDQAPDDKRPFWSERRRGIAFDASVPGIPAFQQRGDRAVDMFA
jgi:flagellar hook-length control protein FliK